MTPRELAQDCIHCKNCTRCCDFLSKYQVDLQGFARRPELAWSCFLCGACRRVCPVDINGRDIALALRRQAVEKAGGRPPRGYGMVLAEKKHYLFQNYRRGKARSVLFPGCNFPSFFPRTTRYLAGLLKETAGVGTVFDCCGKPVAELGLEKEEGRIADGVARRLRACGAEELILLCPNCYYFLKPRLDIPVVSIYEKLAQLGLGRPVEAEELHLFLPCPDRDSRELLGRIQPFVKGEIRPMEGVQCCGLGGCAAVREPELSRGLSRKMAERNLPAVYTYCASCAGVLNRGGCPNVRHILPAILGVEEQPANASLRNRAGFRFY